MRQGVGKSGNVARFSVQGLGFRVYVRAAQWRLSCSRLGSGVFVHTHTHTHTHTHIILAA